MYHVLLALYKSKTLAPNPPKFSRSFYSRDFLLFSSGSLGVFCLQAFTTEGEGVFCHTPNSEKFPAISSAVFGPKVKCETFRKSPQHPCDLFLLIEVYGYGPPILQCSKIRGKNGGDPKSQTYLVLTHRWKCQHRHSELYKK